MKKLFAIISILALSAAVFAEDYEAVKGYHPYNESENKEVVERYAHWSLIPHIGFSAFDGDFNSYKDRQLGMAHPISYPTAGLSLEYDFTPVWAVGVECFYDRYGVRGFKTAASPDVWLQGHMIKAGGYVGMDFMGIFFPHKPRRIFSLNLLAGGGYGWYRSDLYYKDDGKNGHIHSDVSAYVNDEGKNAPDKMTKFNGSAYLMLGASAEFSLNRTLSLGVRATYDYFMSDAVDGRGSTLASKNNDGIFDITLDLRIKFDAVHRSHERNIGGEEGTMAVKRILSGETPAQQQVVHIHHDTVIIYHDTIHTREIIHTEHTTTNTVTQIGGHDNGLIYYVYFASGKSSIDNDGLVTIQQVADRLKADTSLYAVVTGFCDNTGSNSVNYVLGDKRADNVLDELRGEHGISDTHMYSAGLGKVAGLRSTSSYGPNRRAMIQLVDKATFDKMRAELNEQKSHRVADDQPAPKQDAKAQGAGQQQKTVSLKESAAPVQKPEKVNPYAVRPNEMVLVEKTTTLASLARQYYNNTHCWVFIYIANKQKLPNPNALVPGMKLKIPELTPEELKITKDQCLRKYGQARQSK